MLSQNQDLLLLSLVMMTFSSSVTATTSITELNVCIDDSDCADLGSHPQEFRCFQYLCYPWKDPSVLDASIRRQQCRRQSDCRDGQGCFRHSDRRMVTKGLCFDEDESGECREISDCSPGMFCCGGYCCNNEIFAEFKELPCVSNRGCQDLRLGEYCCPQNVTSSFNICCDINPDPKTTTDTMTFSTTSEPGDLDGKITTPVMIAAGVLVLGIIVTMLIRS